jgi:sporulation protein YlmC with PRC-barrel domain
MPRPLQPADRAAPAATTNPTAGSNTKMMLKGNWRASKLMGLDVYNAANEKLGDINELILDKNGKVNAVVIGVGGFLGRGRARHRSFDGQAQIRGRAGPHQLDCARHYGARYNDRGHSARENDNHHYDRAHRRCE